MVKKLLNHYISYTSLVLFSSFLFFGILLTLHESLGFVVSKSYTGLIYSLLIIAIVYFFAFYINRPKSTSKISTRLRFFMLMVTLFFISDYISDKTGFNITINGLTTNQLYSLLFYFCLPYVGFLRFKDLLFKKSL